MEASAYPPPYHTESVGAPRNETHASGVSWPAILAGAVVTAALSLVLLALGTGFGLAAVSPWYDTGASAATMGMAAIGWLILMQIISSSMGGYLAGRLRTKWVGVHTDEVYFRDTAHGFLAWAVALVITAGFLTAAATQMAGAAGAAAATAAASSNRDTPNGYFVDSLFRTDGARPDTSTASVAVRVETTRILVLSLQKGELAPADKTYLTQVVAANTGISRTEADARVTDIFTRSQQVADTTRKLTSHGLLWAFLALLIGAFCASFSATIGGRQRDHVLTA